MSDTLTAERRSWNMSRIKSKDTKPEVFVRSKLHHAGLCFRLHDKLLPGKPDMVLKKYNAVIFVNGCFWHRHEGCPNATTPNTRREFWTEKFNRTMERDREQQEALKSLGWRVLCIWECELKRDAQWTISKIIKTLKGDGDDNRA
jgi:DNA mismatch endonuclease, patch repair protein